MNFVRFLVVLEITSLYLFCAVVFFACQGDEKSKVSIVKSGDVEVIQILDPDDDSEVYLSEFVKEVKIVPLESSPECLIGKVRRIEVSDSGVYILDRHQQDRIFKFDLDGKFVGTVGTLGRSAEEYVELTDFDVEGDTVYIFDRLTDRVFVYDGNGMLVRITDKLSSDGFNFSVRKGMFYLYRSGQSASAGRFSVYDSDGRFIKGYFSDHEWRADGERADVLHGNSYAGGLPFVTPNSDTVYCVSGDTMSAVYSIDFGKHSPTPEDRKVMREEGTSLDYEWYIRKDYAIAVERLNIFPGLFYFEYLYRGVGRPVFFDLETKRYRNSYNVIDDLSFLYFSPPMTAYGNQLVSVYNPESAEHNLDFIERVTDMGWKVTEQGKASYAMLKKVAENVLDQNIILIFYEI